MATQRQIEANRKNAARSSGPKTEAGKAASRANALKHGLACESIDVEAERSPAFQARRDAWAAEYHASSSSDDWALNRAVAASFRIERCEVAVDTLFESTSERAKLTWDQDRAFDAAKLGSRLASNPSLIARMLQTTWHGVNLMIDRWNRLETALESVEGWSELESSDALDLLGVPTHLRNGRTPIDDPDSGSTLAFRQNLVLDEIIRLETLRDTALATLDDLERRNAITGASTLLGAPAKLVLRYEREAWRRYNEAIDTLKGRAAEPVLKPAVQAAPTPASAPIPVPEPSPTPEPDAVEDSGELDGSSDFDPRVEVARMIRELGPDLVPNHLKAMLDATGTNPIGSGSTLDRGSVVG